MDAAPHPVSRFGHVELQDMPDDLRRRIGAITEKSGFVPNVFLALARRPAELRAFLDYHDALMDSDEGLSRAERELRSEKSRVNVNPALIRSFCVI